MDGKSGLEGRLLVIDETLFPNIFLRTLVFQKALLKALYDTLKSVIFVGVVQRYRLSGSDQSRLLETEAIWPKNVFWPKDLVEPGLVQLDCFLYHSDYRDKGRYSF